MDGLGSPTNGVVADVLFGAGLAGSLTLLDPEPIESFVSLFHLNTKTEYLVLFIHLVL